MLSKGFVNLSKLTVLISGIGGDIGQSVARALAGDFRILGCDMEDGVGSRLFVEKFFCVPSAKEREAYLKEIGNIIIRDNVDIFIPISEPEIALLNCERKWVSEVNGKVLLNNKEVVRVFSDKLETAAFLQANGWKAPRSILLKNMIREEWRLPIIVKARSGCGSKSVHKVIDDLTLDYLRSKDHGDLIIQEYLDEAEGEFTTGVFSDGNTTASITFRRRLGFGGLSREVTLVQDSKMEVLARGIAKKTGLIGSINIQSRKSNGEHVPFEINPRLSSTVYLRQAFGFEDLQWWIACLNGGSYIYRPLYNNGTAVRVLVESFIGMEIKNSGSKNGI